MLLRYNKIMQKRTSKKSWKFLIMIKTEEFREAIENNDIKTIQLLLKDKNVEPNFFDNYAICYASKKGYFKVVKLLLNEPSVCPAGDNNYSIRYASKNGHINLVKLLLKDERVNPAAGFNFAICKSYKNQHINIVNLLWQNKKIKNTLKKDNLELYNTLTQEDIKNKVGDF